MLCGRASVKFSNGPDQNFTIFANFAIHNLALKVTFSTFFAKKTCERQETYRLELSTYADAENVSWVPLSRYRYANSKTSNTNCQRWRANFSR